MPGTEMTPEEFRDFGHAVVDWIADYRAGVEELPVRGPVRPGGLREQLPPRLPEEGESPESMLADLDRVIVPALTHWQHPSFFGYFPANASLASVLGDLLSSGLGVQGMSWTTSPAATELEQYLLDGLARELGLPAEFTFPGGGGGVIQDSASSAVLVALLTALHRGSAGAWRSSGLTGGEVVYGSAETHSSLAKAVRVAGLGHDGLRSVSVDPDTLAMRPAALAEAVAEDMAAGRRPVLVCATVGTTGTGAVDPLSEIAAICREHGIWLHVDAAWAGVAALCPELRAPFAGVAEADSFCTNAHKWLMTAFDCGLYWTRHPDVLVDALSILPEYLRDPAGVGGAVVDYRDWQIPLGRRFRALKLWAVLRWFGLRGLREHLRLHVALAEELAELVRGDERFALVTEPSFALVCLRARTGAGAAADDRRTERLLASINESGRAFLSHTAVAGRPVIRVAIGGVTTERGHVLALWRLLGEAFEAAAAG
ncbi:aromatic-L-amino-acid decarboxylase [Actinoalloteichus hoggarensis]|nr:aromatic-L-amino-acid decarboxylase [Actinoalloteichus hoggarensis]